VVIQAISSWLIYDSSDDGREAGNRRVNLQPRISEKGTLSRERRITIISSLPTQCEIFRRLLGERFAKIAAGGVAGMIFTAALP
jgi:hypothetical protein